VHTVGLLRVICSHQSIEDTQNLKNEIICKTIIFLCDIISGIVTTSSNEYVFEEDMNRELSSECGLGSTYSQPLLDFGAQWQ